MTMTRIETDDPKVIAKLDARVSGNAWVDGIADQSAVRELRTHFYTCTRTTLPKVYVITSDRIQPVPIAPIAESESYEPPQPRRVLSPAHLAALKAGRAKARAAKQG